MKLDRLLSIVILLSKNEIMTAPQLAERFEVSRRTINRDIEALCMAGIPIVTRQGNKGGIYIQEGYKIDKNVLKDNELSEIITGLKALSSVSATKDIETLLNKITPDDVEHESIDNIIKIQLGSFYKDSISEKIELIKRAVSQHKCVTFTYYSKNGKSKKKVEPYRILFKWDNWYLYGYTNDFRMYKLNRLWDLKITDETYAKRDVPEIVNSSDNIFEDNYRLKAIFDSSVEYMLVEDYGDKCYEELEDSTLLFERDFTNYNHMLSWVLKFGDDIRVIEPKELKQSLKSIAQNTIKMYD